MDIEVFLKAFPLVATSPYAFIAYVLLVAAWFVLGLRVRRNKNLLDVLEKLPTQQRLPALQAEMGHVSPPQDLTPEQWLKSRTNAYYFFGFIALCFCITLIALVTYVFMPEDPSKKVSSSVELFKESTDNKQNPAKTNELRYEASIASDNTISINPVMPYLASLTEAKEVQGLQYWYEPFEWSFPELSVKVVNNSKSTLMISRIDFDVVESEVDDSPIPLIHESFYNVGHVQLVNEGWGSMLKPKLSIKGWRLPSSPASDIVFLWRFGVTTQDPCDGPERLVGSPVTLNLEEVGEEENISVSEYIPSIFKKEPLVCVVGGVTYEVKGSSTPVFFKFRTLVSQFNPGPGAPAPPSAEYDLFLPAGKKNYVASVSVSQVIKPGETDHFLIRVASDKSASFKLKYNAKEVSNIYLGGQLLSLKLFVPRSGADRGELSSKSFPQLPLAFWGAMPLAKTIANIVYNPDDKGDIRIYLNQEVGKVGSCDEYFETLSARLKTAPFPNQVRFGIVNSQGEMICTSGLRTIRTL